MRASEPLKSKRFAISLFAWSTAFFSSTLLTSETMSKEGISDFPRVDAELYRPSVSSEGKPELGCRDHPDRLVPGFTSRENRHLTFRAQSNKEPIRNGTTNNH